MRIYKNFKEMFSEVWRDVFELGIRTKSESVQNMQNVGEEYDMSEIIGYSYQLENVDLQNIFSNFSEREIKWLVAEFAERISFSHVNPGEAWKIRDKIWGSFRHGDGKFDYTYNERIKPQLTSLITELRKRPNTRQAVMTIFDHRFDLPFLGGYRRIPCSLTYQFICRGGRLYTVYSMRSCDVATHFRFDVALACLLTNYIATEIHVQSGSLVHHIGSLHCFRKDSEGIF